MLTWRYRLAAALLLLLELQVPTSADSQSSLAGWHELLGWLPEDTETVIVAQGPVDIPDPEAKRYSFQQALEQLPIGPILGLQDGLLHRQLFGRKVLLAVEGSRRFKSPKALGGMLYEGVHILQFDPAFQEILREVFQTCYEKAEEKVELAGNAVAVFKETMESDEWTFFLSQPRPGILICATDSAYLEETLKRIDRKPVRYSLPADLPEWKHVNVKARVWAVRHYRKESAGDDPSSPLRSKAAANVPDPDALGFVFWYDPESKVPARARYLSGAKNALKLVTQGWYNPPERLTPEITQVTPNAVEIVPSVSEDEAAHIFLFVLFLYLGHAIYL